jgi:hypothetical protein
MPVSYDEMPNYATLYLTKRQCQILNAALHEFQAGGGFAAEDAKVVQTMIENEILKHRVTPSTHNEQE